MRKSQLILAVAIMLVLVCVVALGSTARHITAEVNDYSIKVNGATIDKDFSVVTIDGRAYVPVRALGDISGFGVNWNEEESAIEISTGTVQTGYQGIDEWKQRDLQLTAENALIIGEEVFHHTFSEEFINTTDVHVWETEDGNYYNVWRADKDTDDYSNEEGCISIIIRKSDGKIMRFEAGE